MGRGLPDYLRRVVQAGFPEAQSDSSICTLFASVTSHVVG
jgi:hypothetical protein